MAHEIENMAYVGETPWHGLGRPVDETLTPEEMMRAAGCDWKVVKKNLHARVKNADGKETTVKAPGHFGLFRESDWSLLDVVGDGYNPVQNEDAFAFFKEFTTAGKMKMHTAGSLCSGQYIWALAKLDREFRLPGGDVTEGHILLMSPHRLGKAMVIKHCLTRVVCMNTIQMALRESTSTFRMSHLRKFNDDVRREAEEVVGLASKQFDEMEEAAQLLSATKAPKKKVTEYFMQVFNIDPKDLEDDKRFPKALEQANLALKHSPGATLESADGTWWGALNAVTYVSDHILGESDEIRLRNNWVGKKGSRKLKAVSLALDFARAA